MSFTTDLATKKVYICLADSLCLRRRWADVAIGAVPTGSIVVHFNILESSLPQDGAIGKSFTMNGFHF